MSEGNRRANGEPAYRVSYRQVRYPRLEFKTGTLLVVVPRSSSREPADVLYKHRRWVDNRRKLIEAALKEAEKKTLDTRRSEEEFRDLVRNEARRFSARLDCEVGELFFRKLTSKWASCSARGNLTFNRYLRFLPQNLIEYVVYHEVAHTNNRRHDARFLRTLRMEYVDSDQRERELLAFWFLLQEAIRDGEVRL